MSAKRLFFIKDRIWLPGLFLIIELLFLLLLSCAHQIPPSGGPPDKTPPKIVRVFPEKGTLNFPQKGKILLQFSEWIDRRGVEKAITIFPRLQNGFKVKVSGAQIEIEPLSAFRESTTYHIEVNSQLKDLRNNTLRDPVHIVFSTADKIDSGKIVGCIVAGKNVLSSQSKVALFWSDSAGCDTVFFTHPDYLIQTDSMGRFTFEYIRKGRYIVLGFLDQNGDNRFQPMSERAYAPLKYELFLDTAITSLYLYPITSDTSITRISSLTAYCANALMGVWSNNDAKSMGVDISEWKIVSMTSSATPVQIERLIPIGRSNKFVLLLSNNLSIAPYRLVYPLREIVSRKTTKDNQIYFDSIRFNGTTLADTNRPLVLRVEPYPGQSNIFFRPSIRIVWSEPVRIINNSFVLADTLGDTIRLVADSSFSDTTTLSPLQRLRPSMRYSTVLKAKFFEDIAGNHPPDSPKIEITFTTMSIEDICFSLSGKQPCLASDSLRMWVFEHFNGSKFVCHDKNNAFRFDTIVAGKGRIGFFTDINRDSLPTVGRLIPWRPPEPFILLSDTVEARARWDIENVVLKSACDPCPKK